MFWFQMRLTCAARTDPGRRREANEDSFCTREDLGLFIVADGMGGHVAGEIASRLVVQEVERFVAATPSAAAGHAPALGGKGSAGDRLGAALVEANRLLAARIAEDAALQGMATTAVALLSEAGDITLAHVGDSRAYRWRAGHLTQLTSDHSWVEEEVRAGRLTAAEARRHPWKHVVTRAISGGTDLEVEVSALALEQGDRILLCSDGLSTVVADRAIAEALRVDRPSHETCDELVRRANNAGGPDNVTVVLIEAHAE
ncbi:MAG: Stp1/IreP family PP2C-type Ser/Thr phosphatase [Acidobacteria bacterium]|nr:Stp1/IreP family PP2C-type Ser/Thr phosphatase [Acidobacteriota bacterium]